MVNIEELEFSEYYVMNDEIEIRDLINTVWEGIYARIEKINYSYSYEMTDCINVFTKIKVGERYYEVSVDDDVWERVLWDDVETILKVIKEHEEEAKNILSHIK